MANDKGSLARQLDASDVTLLAEEPALAESEFRWQLNYDPMAADLLADGIRRFSGDQEKLEALLQEEVDA